MDAWRIFLIVRHLSKIYNNNNNNNNNIIIIIIIIIILLKVQPQY